MNTQNFLKAWLPVIALCALIFHISSFPTATTSSVQWQDFTAKKFAHVFEYGILAILTYRALIKSGTSRKNACIYAILFVFIYGSSDEIHQRFVPGRESRFRDVVIDTFGATLGILGVWSIVPRTQGKLRHWAKALDLLS